MTHLLSFTGSSGVGKTTLARALVERMPRVSMVKSYTTREKRLNDLSGEYEYISPEEYDLLATTDVFLKPIQHVGNRYGTRKSSIDAVFAHGPHDVGIMILVPEIIPVLRNYLAAKDRIAFHVPVFIVPPSEDVLRTRLVNRGDKSEDIERRLSEAVSWEAEVRASTTIPYHFIRNDGDLEGPLEKIIALVSGNS